MGETVRVGGSGYVETVFSVRFSCEPKTSLKNSLLKNDFTKLLGINVSF